jgi:hypothetical protein
MAEYLNKPAIFQKFFFSNKSGNRYFTENVTDQSKKRIDDETN